MLDEMRLCSKLGQLLVKENILSAAGTLQKHQTSRESVCEREIEKTAEWQGQGRIPKRELDPDRRESRATRQGNYVRDKRTKERAETLQLNRATRVADKQKWEEVEYQDGRRAGEREREREQKWRRHAGRR